MPIRATAVWHPDVPRGIGSQFDLPGVSLSHRNDPKGEGEVFLIFGGDGTVHRHLETLHAAQIPTLIVPTGSGNDFAHAIGIHTVADALSAWKKFVAGQGIVRQIDLGCIEQIETNTAVLEGPAIRQFGSSAIRQLFCCIGGVGLDADANRRANTMPRWLRRRGGYMLAAAMAIMGKQRTHMRAHATSTAGEPLLDADELAEMVVFANASTYGDGLMIAPGAKLDDGKLDLIYVRHSSRLRLVRIAPTVLRGTHIGLPEVWFARAAEVRVESHPPRMIYADGEPICHTPVRVSVIPKALRVLSP
jgi:diacylglycerol kinase (ATP)